MEGTALIRPAARALVAVGEVAALLFVAAMQAGMGFELIESISPRSGPRTP